MDSKGATISKKYAMKLDVTGRVMVRKILMTINNQVIVALIDSGTSIFLLNKSVTDKKGLKLQHVQAKS